MVTIFQIEIKNWRDFIDVKILCHKSDMSYILSRKNFSFPWDSTLTYFYGHASEAAIDS